MVSHESCHRQFALTGFTRIERMDLRMKIALLDGVCNENDVSGLFKVAMMLQIDTALYYNRSRNTVLKVLHRYHTNGEL